MQSFLPAHRGDIQELVQIIETYSGKDPRESIGVAASLAGEAVWHRLGFANDPDLNLAPGKSLAFPLLGDYLLGGEDDLKNVPYTDSPLGPLRSLLEEAQYPLEEGPRLLDFACAYRGLHYSPEEPLLLTLPFEEGPQKPALKAALDLREKVVALAEKIIEESPDEARYLLTVAALAEILDKSRESLSPVIALTIACQTLLAVAKTAPFTEEAPARPAEIPAWANASLGPAQ